VTRVHGRASIAALAAALAVVVGLAAACNPRPTTDSPDAPPASPQASAVPAPLAVGTTTVPSANTPPASPDSGPPPVPLRGDVPLPPDVLSRESASGYTLSAVLRPGDVVAPPRAPEVSNAGLEAARKKTELRLAIDLGTSRMRVALLGSGWVLPEETELRSRVDRYGHVVVWPGGATYRPLAPGALRALIGERRFDVAPITPADVSAREEAGKRIGIRTRRVDVSTRAAKATFEVGRLADLGDGGVLLCRVLLDLMNAPPSTAVCTTDELPVRADLRWTGRGSLGFELTGVLKKADMPTTPLLVPPPTASFASAPFPVSGVTPTLTPPEFAAFRTNPGDPATPPPGGGTGPTEGLVIANATDQLRVVHIDGIPVAWAAPGARDTLHGFLRGRYTLQWRTFLGESFEPGSTQPIPGTTHLGAADAGK